MRHLFPSIGEVLRSTRTMTNGNATLGWALQSTLNFDPAVPLGQLRCRLDLSFLRPGKDQPAAIVAGRAPDRTGVLFFTYTPLLKAGDRLHMISGPVTGTFEMRVIPDPAVGYAAVHHAETQVIEVAQDLVGVFPAAPAQG